MTSVTNILFVFNRFDQMFFKLQLSCQMKSMSIHYCILKQHHSVTDLFSLWKKWSWNIHFMARYITD